MDISSDVSKFAGAPSATAYKLLDYDVAGVIPGFVNDTWFLVVNGQAPCMNMEVTLAPVIYVNCPEYWQIELVGYLPGPFCLKALKDFSLVIPLHGITGSKGIKMVGATKSDQFEVGGGCGSVGK